MITQDVQVDLIDFFDIMKESIRSVQVALNKDVTHLVIHPSNDNRQLKKNVVCQVMRIKGDTVHFKKRITRGS